MSKINIVIADDHVLFVEGLRSLLKDASDMTITDVANNGKELLEKLKSQHPDIVLLDIDMPLLNGIESARRIHESMPHIKIIILSTYSEEYLIEKAKSVGVRGYLLKNCNKSELTGRIRSVFNGELSFPKKIPPSINQFNEKDEFLRQFNLTKREIEIIQLIRQGLTNQQIAEKLSLSIYTVETHRKNIMQKLALHKPAELMRFILEHNL